ncbi:alpha/beta fold hydrolase [Paraburkholderia hayleyella]|uniref:alpha/beta fold hydrolase n=1 Tax=Paraburkholderia hayleyella TaxID=2152889 RepID=UPI001290FA42|nr:alpha/beta fold hydrolase [Paraburkholderia hayleyella]
MNTLEQLSKNDLVKPKTYFITGATGFVGSHFLYWSLRQARSIYVLVRADDLPSARSRIIMALTNVAAAYKLPLNIDYLNKITFIIGDVTLPNCGISDAHIAELAEANIDEFWHIAANLQYEEKNKSLIYNVNVNGTRNVLDLIKQIRGKRFFYVSTAYVCGKMQGPIMEVLHPLDIECNNSYEASKNIAEHSIDDFCRENEIEYNIFRPSVVVGPSSTHHNGNSDSGLYGLARGFFDARKLLGKASDPIRCYGRADSYINFLPVDQLIVEMIAVSRKDFINEKIYHVTNPENFNCERVMNIIAANFNFQIKLEDEIPSMSGVERFFVRRCDFYWQYVSSRKIFQRSQPALLAINWNDVEQYINSYCQELESLQSKESGFDSYLIKTGSEIEFPVYEMGKNKGKDKTIIMVNAVGMSADFFLPLAKRLSEHARVITWDRRDLPLLTPFDPGNCGDERHIDDLITICDFIGVERASVLSWCTGTQLAMRALAAYPDRFIAGIFLNPDFTLETDEEISQTEFQRRLRKMLPIIANDFSVAEHYYDLMFAPAKNDNRSESSAMISSFVNLTDNAVLMRLMSEPFGSPEKIYRYANIFSNMALGGGRENNLLIKEVAQPVYIYTSVNDSIAHYKIAECMGGRLKHSEVYIDSFGDHFSHYHDSALSGRILSFLDRVGTGKIEKEVEKESESEKVMI